MARLVSPIRLAAMIAFAGVPIGLALGFTDYGYLRSDLSLAFAPVAEWPWIRLGLVMAGFSVLFPMAVAWFFSTSRITSPEEVYVGPTGIFFFTAYALAIPGPDSFAATGFSIAGLVMVLALIYALFLVHQWTLLLDRRNEAERIRRFRDEFVDEGEAVAPAAGAGGKFVESLDAIVGKEIKHIVIKESDRLPKSQVFLVFEDSKWMEFYSNGTIQPAKHLQGGGLPSVRRYLAEDSRITFEV